MNDRGMMKWAPYQSLVEQSSILSKMLYEKGKRPKPHISSDRAEEINNVLVNYHQEEVRARYWEDGYLYVLVSNITKIDVMAKVLLLGDKTIPFSCLIELESL